MAITHKQNTRRGGEEELKKALEEVQKIGLGGEWRDMQALAYAVKKELQPTLDQYAQLMKDNKATTIRPFDFVYCLTKFWIDKEAIAKFVEMWEEMCRQGIRPSLIVSNAFLKGYALQGNTEGVTRTLEQIKKDGLQPNVMTYSGLIEAYARDNIEEAHKWLEEMKRQGLKPDRQSYVPFADFYAKKNEVEGLKKVLEDMKRDGVRIDFRYFAFMINERSRNGDKAGAEYWLDEMMKAGWTPTPKQRELVANVGTPTEQATAQ
jgi:pentatricopeptide repeat protein